MMLPGPPAKLPGHVDPGTGSGCSSGFAGISLIIGLSVADWIDLGVIKKRARYECRYHHGANAGPAPAAPGKNDSIMGTFSLTG
jgi:hypothetical protein